MPRPCQASATAKASSARSPLLGHEAGVGDDVAVGAGGRDEPDAAVDEPARRAQGGDAAAHEAKPARLGRQRIEERRHGVDVGGDGGAHVDRRAVAQDDVAVVHGRG